MLDIHRLEIFIKVAEFKNFSKAANAMYLTQPTISQHITSLENYLDIALFDRMGKEVKLTKAGEILYQYAKQITALMGEARQALDHFQGKKRGHLILGGSTIPGEYILPALLGRFKVLYPEIRITLRIGDTKQIINEVIEGTIELGIIGAKINNPRLHFVRFLEDELIVVVPLGHRWWNKTCIDVHNLIDEPIIIRERGSGTRISMENKLQQLGIPFDSLNIIAEVGSTTAVKQAIKAKLGITLISERAVDDEIQLKLFKKIPIKKTKITRSFYIIRDKKRTPSPLSKALSHFLSIQN
jgi:DNA-binding transcriptional LysR family regulator